MKITHDFTVSVPVERAWAVLTDLEAVAPCMPGAQLTGVDGGVYSGKVKVKVGPVVSEYAGTVRFAEKDDANHHAVIDAKGRDSRGAGTAAAIITAQLTSDGDRTVVTVDTDLKISGRIAQFGSGMIKEVSQKLLGQFVERLEEKLATDSSVAGAPPVSEGTATPLAAPAETPEGTGATAAPAPVTADTVAAPAAAEPEPAVRRVVAPEPEPLDMMSVAGGSLYKRAIPVLVVLIVVVVVAVYLLVS
ncbi:SRPBCC family protein [Planotetraspora kaengkrachanensis]|uniref:Carbon monoxide dehydrogenase subunit G (CoxG) family protein n=1 Tax=Planotetraspora kaengkrachanensis TaxID=575193 RepID=A0A8J3LVN8_9ACTN|nr:SRPBCC family protein [Planotetraspora kaengkrachanensis]GIG77368.1 carbon monoxide dehydrogenase subunit G (CoxG) family protein [Planotetraspora kaengkrachanensis]